MRDLRGDSPHWQAPIPILPDDPVNAPIIARYLAHHAALANADALIEEPEPEPSQRKRDRSGRFERSR